jgi:hypothetical protein
MKKDLLQTVRRYCKMLFGVGLESKNPANVDYGCVLGGVALRTLS